MKTKALLAEFIGTFALIFIGVGAIAADSMSGGKAGLTGIAIAHGLTIAVMVSATAAISGGHLNPAVTIGALVGKKIDFGNAIGYIICQCFGAVAGAYMISLAVSPSVLSAIQFGTPSPGVGVTSNQVIVMEAVLTFFLVFVVYGTAIDRRAPKVGGLFIGLTIILGILAGGPVTGAAINPARHFGPALLGGHAEHIWLYWIGPVLGGVVAGLVYSKLLEE